MPTYIEKPTQSDKVIPIIFGISLLAFFACLPFMARDDNRRAAQAWKSYGCEMYDDYKPSDVPAKCSAYFIDHYQAQQARLQPPAQKEQP